MEFIFSPYSRIALRSEWGLQKDVWIPFLCTLLTTITWIISVCSSYLWIRVLDTFFPSSIFFLFLFLTVKTHPRSKSCTWMFYTLFQRRTLGNKTRKDKASSVETFHILNMDDIQVWEAKDRLLFIVKFQRMQTLFHCAILRYHSQSFFVPKLKEWRGPAQFICVKHWSTSTRFVGENRCPNAVGKIKSFQQ